jgi:hypothetical protein
MKRSTTGTAHVEYGVRMASRDIVINAMLAAAEKLNQGSKGIYSNPMVSFFSATHASAQGDAIHVRIIGGSHCDNGFPRKLTCAGVAKPEATKGSTVPEDQAPVDGIHAELFRQALADSGCFATIRS